MKFVASRWLAFEKPLMEVEEELYTLREEGGADEAAAVRIAELVARREALLDELYSDLTAYQKVLLARHPQRPYALDYIARCFDDFTELHGDRRFGDDRAFVCGPARLNGRGVMVIAHQKGRDVEERKLRNFAQGRPEGYRKTQRLMDMAERMRMPVICLIDTPAADCLTEAESRGISEAIAEGMMMMSTLRTPIIVAVIGEGGSGGAIGIGVGDVVLMLEYAIYSVIPPEGYASIVWRDAGRVAEASELAKITAADAQRLGVIDEIVPEPRGGAHADAEGIAATLKDRLIAHMERLCLVPTEELIAARYAKFRAMGIYGEAEVSGAAAP
jgi:acetyl-CoA carboxylase carboxyl transferase subunit alpha